MKTTRCEYQHIPSEFNLSKHPTCDSVRRERRRLLQEQEQQHQYQHQQQLNYNSTVSKSSSLNHHQHDTQYYLSCYVAGGMSSSIRWVLSPLELIKTRLQTTSAAMVTVPASMIATTTATAPLVGTVSAVSVPSNTMMSTFVQIYTNEGGIKGLFRGVTPTAVAYWLQTSTKYSLYEYFKDQFSSSSTKNSNNSNWNRNLTYVAAAASAEAIADILMCPFEMVKVKMQTSQASIQASSGIKQNRFSSMKYHPSFATNIQRQTFPKDFIPAFKEMIYHRKKYNFPFGSLGPLWGRQIPGTIVNFFTFETAVSTIYNTLGNGTHYQRSDYTPIQQLGVTVMAGYIAGVCCAIVSHPADSIISLKSLPEHSKQSIPQIIQKVGWYRLTTKGLLPRIVMTGQIIAFQWLLYDGIKSMCFGYGTSGG